MWDWDEERRYRVKVSAGIVALVMLGGVVVMVAIRAPGRSHGAAASTSRSAGRRTPTSGITAPASTSEPATTVPSVTTVPVITVPVTAAPVVTTPAADALPLSSYQDSFDGGQINVQRWRSADAVVTADAAHSGPFGVRLTSIGSGAYLNLASDVLSDVHRSFVFDGWFRVQGRGPHQAPALATIRDTVGVDNADFFIDGASGDCRADLVGTDLALSSVNCGDGGWHHVEMRGDFGASTYVLSWSVDGVPQPSVRSAGVSPSFVKSLWLGGLTTKANVVDWDDVALVLSDAAQQG
jgi:hypothetical protein